MIERGRLAGDFDCLDHKSNLGTDHAATYCLTCSKFQPHSGTEKGPQRTCVTKILPNFWVNFLVRFALKPFFCW